MSSTNIETYTTIINLKLMKFGVKTALYRDNLDEDNLCEANCRFNNGTKKFWKLKQSSWPLYLIKIEYD